MNFCETKNIDKVWENICKHEGEIFLTSARKKIYRYIVKDDSIIVNGEKTKVIKKEGIAKALNIENPTRAKIAEEGIWWSSYVYGIITDKRIL